MSFVSCNTRHFVKYNYIAFHLLLSLVYLNLNYRETPHLHLNTMWFSHIKRWYSSKLCFKTLAFYTLFNTVANPEMMGARSLGLLMTPPLENAFRESNHYCSAVKQVEGWCRQNNLQLNVNKQRWCLFLSRDYHLCASAQPVSMSDLKVENQQSDAINKPITSRHWTK